MFKKANAYFADWRDATGKRHRASFKTRAEAREHETKMKAAAKAIKIFWAAGVEIPAKPPATVTKTKAPRKATA